MNNTDEKDEKEKLIKNIEKLKRLSEFKRQIAEQNRRIKELEAESSPFCPWCGYYKIECKCVCKCRCRGS